MSTAHRPIYGSLWEKKNPTPLLECNLEDITIQLTLKNVVKKRCVCTNTQKCIGEYVTKADTI